MGQNISKCLSTIFILCKFNVLCIILFMFSERIFCSMSYEKSSVLYGGKQKTCITVFGVNIERTNIKATAPLNLRNLL